MMHFARCLWWESRRQKRYCHGEHKRISCTDLLHRPLTAIKRNCKFCLWARLWNYNIGWSWQTFALINVQSGLYLKCLQHVLSSDFTWKSSFLKMRKASTLTQAEAESFDAPPQRSWKHHHTDSLLTYHNKLHVIMVHTSLLCKTIFTQNLTSKVYGVSLYITRFGSSAIARVEELARRVYIAYSHQWA